jgi:enamine deaminase RidA (YjgF/YER057c/UK114 family)
MDRQTIESGSPLEPEIGFSRAVRVGPHIWVAGTAPIAAGGGTGCPGDVYGQTLRCFEITEKALRDAGALVSHVTRTRLLLTDIAHWRDAARAHGEFFRAVRPALTVMQVTAFIDPSWLVETEVDAIIA